MTEGKGSLAGWIRHAGLGAALASLAGCTLITDSFLTNEFSGDPFPVHVETTSGAIVVGLRQAAHADREVVLDLLSPITLADPGFMTSPSLSFVDVTLLGADEPGAPLVRPRARFRDAQLVSVHPCEDACAAGEADCDPAQCYVGSPSVTQPATRRPFDGIIGADMLAGDAVRLRLGDDQLFVLPDVGGSDRGRSLSCDAVFASPYRGGGTLVVGGTELPFGGRRITMHACLGADPDPRVGDPGVDVDDASKLRPSGSDALFVMSTGVGISIINETAYQRYLLSRPGAPVEPRTPATVYLPSWPVHGDIVHIDRLTLIASASSNPLSPCRQVYAHRLLTARGKIDQRLCAPDGEPANNIDTFNCVCKNDSEFCDAPAMIELAPVDPTERIEVLVVPDKERTLQALRTELRPDQAEVDGVLGTNVLRNAEIDVDYPHDRLIARCSDAGCTARPQLARDEDRLQIRSCLRGQPTGPILPE